jgi:hypothetical protein
VRRLLLLGVAGAAGGFWYFSARGAPDAPPRPPPAAVSSADTARGPADSAAVAPPSQATASAAPGETREPVAVPIADSGALKLVGLPAGSSVLIDGAPVTTSVTPLPVGRHAVGVLAPQHEFFEDTVQIEVDQLLEIEPALARRGAPLATIRRRAERRLALPPRDSVATCDRPVAGYNAGNACYDVRPRPTQAGGLPLPEGVTAVPTSSLLLVHVGADGRALEVRPLRPSSDSLFEAAAQRFAATVDWVPALKNGSPVPGWTQQAVIPQR